MKTNHQPDTTQASIDRLVQAAKSILDLDAKLPDGKPMKTGDIRQFIKIRNRFNERCVPETILAMHDRIKELEFASNSYRQTANTLAVRVCIIEAEN